MANGIRDSSDGRDLEPSLGRKKRRARLIPVGLVAAIAVTALVLLGYNGPMSTKLAGGPDVRVDNYAAGVSSDLQGVEPSVAVSPNGTIGVAWIAFDPIVPTLYFTIESNFTTAIWYSASYDRGASYSPPQIVSLGCAACVDPSVSFTSNGAAVVSYLFTPASGPNNSVTPPNDSVMLGVESPGQTSFTDYVVQSGRALDRPWMVISQTGVVYVAYDSADGDSVSKATYPDFTDWGTTAILTSRAEVTSLDMDAAGNLDLGVWSNDQTVGFVRWTPGTGLAQISGMTNITTTGVDFPLGAIISFPGPAVAATDSGPCMVYTDNNDTDLLLRCANPGGQWGPARIVVSSPGGLIEMPAAASTSDGTVLLVSWEQTEGGYWGQYALAYLPASGTVTAVVRLSSQNGYSADVRNWHGDFNSVSFGATSNAYVSWCDGRGGLLPDVGFGHIFSAAITVVPGHGASVFSASTSRPAS